MECNNQQLISWLHLWINVKRDVVNLCRISLLQQTSAFISFLVHVSGRGGKPKVDASQMPLRCPDASQMPLRCLSDASQMLLSSPSSE